MVKTTLSRTDLPESDLYSAKSGRVFKTRRPSTTLTISTTSSSER